LFLWLLLFWSRAIDNQGQMKPCGTLLVGAKGFDKVMAVEYGEMSVARSAWGV